MSSAATAGLSTRPRNSLPWFLGIELVCIVGFIVFTGQGKMEWALAFLFGPMQLLAWIVLLRDSYHILVFFSALLPLAAGELLPHVYQQFFLYPGTVLLIAGLLLTRHIDCDVAWSNQLAGWDRMLLAALSALVVVSGINAVLRGWGSMHLQIYTLLTLEVLAITYFLAVIPRTVHDVRVLLYVVVGMTLLAVVGVASLPTPVNEGGVLGGKVVTTPAGRLNLNTFGCVMAVVAAIIVGLLVEEERIRSRLLLGVALVPVLVMLVMTKSRGAWLGLGVAYLYLLFRSRSVWLLAVMAVAGAVLLSSEVLRGVLTARAGQTSAQDPSFIGRLILWKYAWDVGRDNWLLGVGMENFRAIKHVYGYPQPRLEAFQYNAHSLYLEIFADLGIPGALALISLMFRSFLRSFRLTGSTSLDIRGPALALGAGLIAYAAHGLVDAFTYQHGTLALLGVLIGLSLSLYRLGSAPDAGGHLAGRSH